MLNLVDVSKNSDKYFILQVRQPLPPLPRGMPCMCAHSIQLQPAGTRLSSIEPVESANVQAVEQANKALAVFTRWGRTGTAGSCATEQFADVEAAVEAFGKKFEQKTGVAWEAIHSYTPQVNKYLWCGSTARCACDVWVA